MTERDHNPVKRELERMQSTFAALAAQVPGAIFRYRLGPDGSDAVSYMSPGCVELWELSPEQIMNDATAFWEMIDPADLDGMQKSVAASARTLEPWRHRWRITTPSGKRKWLEGRGIPERDEHGTVEWNSIIIDDTDHVEAEREREALEEKLRQTTRMEAIGRLAGGVAHDFNNMLAVILSSVEVCEQAGEGKAVADSLEAIRQAAERSAELTRKLVSLGRPRSQLPGRVDIGRHLESLAPLLQSLVGGDITVHLDQPDRPCVAAMPSSDLDQIVTNLAVNARDAMSGKGSVHISCSAADETGHCRLSVCDTGPGIDPEVMPHIFEPFFSTKTDGSNSGLGLATVYAAAGRNGGSVSVENVPHRGACFRVELPLSADHEEPRDEVGDEDTAAAEVPGRSRLLIVDDEPPVRAVIKRLLELLGHDVVAVDSPDEALALLQEGPFDAVIADVSMPGMSGWTLLRRIRERFPGMPCVAMSGFSSQPPDDDLQTPFIAKPFQLEDLRDALHRALAASGRA